MSVTKKILSDIDNTLYSKAEKIDTPVIDEDLGVIIYFATLYKYTNEALYSKKAQHLLEKTIEDFPNHELNYSLVHGFEGIFWVVNYLKECQILESEEILKNLEPYLIESIEYDLKNYKYNILHGCLGKIQYYIHSKNQDPDTVQRIVNQTVDALYENKIENDFLINWQDKHLSNGINISFFDGHPSVLKFLVRLKELGYKNDRIDQLISKLIHVLLVAADQPKGVRIKGQSYSIEESEYSHVAELHGNLTVAHALCYAGNALNRLDLEEKAHTLALEACSKQKENSGVMYFDTYDFYDIGLGHGLGGVTYLFFKLNAMINDPLIEQSMLYWKNELLNNVEKVLQIPGTILMPTILQNESNTYPYDKYSLFDGILGSGLVLVSMHYNKDDWGSYLTLY